MDGIVAESTQTNLDELRAKTRVIVPAYNDPAMLKRIVAILGVDGWPTIITDDTQDGVRQGGNQAAARAPHVQHYQQNHKRLGVAGNWNEGLNFALRSDYEAAEFFIIVNQDAQPKPGCILAMVQAMASGRASVVGVKSSGPRVDTLHPFLFDPEAWIPGITGWCFGFTREVVERLGTPLFDERFSPAFWEDTDFVARCHQLGEKFIPVEVGGAICEHLPTSTRDPEMQGTMHAHRAVFFQKYPPHPSTKLPITLAVLAKNEEGRIERLLASARKFVEKIVVLDDGSTDLTMDACKAWGATVGRFEDLGDGDTIADKRNALLALARRHVHPDGWLLTLDADESIPDWEALRRFWPFLCPDAVYAPTFHFVSEKGEPLGIPFHRAALFRLTEGRRYEGPIHEHLLDSKGDWVTVRVVPNWHAHNHGAVVRDLASERIKHRDVYLPILADALCDDTLPAYKRAYYMAKVADSMVIAGAGAEEVKLAQADVNRFYEEHAREIPGGWWEMVIQEQGKNLLLMGDLEGAQGALLRSQQLQQARAEGEQTEGLAAPNAAERIFKTLRLNINRNGRVGILDINGRWTHSRRQQFAMDVLQGGSIACLEQDGGTRLVEVRHDDIATWEWLGG